MGPLHKEKARLCQIVLCFQSVLPSPYPVSVTKDQKPILKLGSSAGPSEEMVELVLHNAFIFATKWNGNVAKCLV